MAIVLVEFQYISVFALKRYFLKKYIVYLFLERGEGRERERVRDIDV